MSGWWNSWNHRQQCSTAVAGMAESVWWRDGRRPACRLCSVWEDSTNNTHVRGLAEEHQKWTANSIYADRHVVLIGLSFSSVFLLISFSFRVLNYFSFGSAALFFIKKTSKGLSEQALVLFEHFLGGASSSGSVGSPMKLWTPNTSFLVEFVPSLDLF